MVDRKYLLAEYPVYFSLLQFLLFVMVVFVAVIVVLGLAELLLLRLRKRFPVTYHLHKKYVVPLAIGMIGSVLITMLLIVLKSGDYRPATKQSQDRFQSTPKVDLSKPAEPEIRWIREEYFDRQLTWSDEISILRNRNVHHDLSSGLGRVAGCLRIDNSDTLFIAVPAELVRGHELHCRASMRYTNTRVPDLTGRVDLGKRGVELRIFLRQPGEAFARGSSTTSSWSSSTGKWVDLGHSVHVPSDVVEVEVRCWLRNDEGAFWVDDLRIGVRN